MAKRIFDQEQPRSALARRLNEAFAGCEKWTTAPPRPPRAVAPPRAPRLTQLDARHYL
ncbi:MAG: hypothetical protein U0R52_09105 [Solirubrobacterales bacterium]